MDGECKLEDLTIDATIHGAVIEVEDSGGELKYVAGRYREPHVEQIFCSNCGEDVYIDDSIDKAVKEHIYGDSK